MGVDRMWLLHANVCIFIIGDQCNINKNKYCPEKPAQTGAFSSYSVKNSNSNILYVECSHKNDNSPTHAHTDPVRQRPERGGGRQDRAEADHGPAAGDPVLLPAHQPWQQRRRAAAPRVHRDGARHPAHQALPHRQGRRRRHGDRPAAPRADHRESQVSGEKEDAVTV